MLFCHSSTSVYYCDCKPNYKNQGRPGNEVLAVGCWQFVKKRAQKQILQQSDAVFHVKSSSSPALVDIHELCEYFCELLKVWLLSSDRLTVNTKDEHQSMPDL